MVDKGQAKQSSLGHVFDAMKTGPVEVEGTKGASSYLVVLDGELSICTCKHATFNGARTQLSGRAAGAMGPGIKWCKHAERVKADILGTALAYYKSRGQVAASFADAGDENPFDTIMMGMLARQERLGQWVAGAFMLQALMDGKANADDVHAMLGPLVDDEGKPVDGRLIGAVLQGLIKTGQMKPVGYMSSQRKAVNHGRPIRIVELTEKGRHCVMQAVKTKQPIEVMPDV